MIENTNREIDINRLKAALKDYYGTAAFNGFPIAVIDLAKVDRMSDLEIIEAAKEKRMDLNKYLL